MRVPIDDGHNEAVVDNGEDEDDAVGDAEQDSDGERLFQHRRTADVCPRPIALGGVRDVAGVVGRDDVQLLVQE